MTVISALPVIGDPTPGTLKLSAVTGGSVSASFSYANTGGEPLNADANPGASWLTVLSNAPKPLPAGSTATVSLRAICPATPGPLSTTVIVTANDSRIPRKSVTVNLSCTAPAAALGLGITQVGTQSVPPYGTASNPALVSGRVSVSGYVQAGANPVSRVQVFAVGGSAPLSELAVSVPANTRQDGITQANLDTTLLPDGSYSFFVRAIDSGGASADSNPVSVQLKNASSSPAVSEIRQVGSTPVSPGDAPVAISGSTQISARLYAGAGGYNGNVYLCLQRGNPQTGGSVNTPIGIQSANIQPGAVYDFGYTWETRSAGNTPADAPYDTLFLSGSRACDDVSNPATTSFIRVLVKN
ncbi:hypothetical protein [Deinococcus sp.]|uniref:hypothetical protein n=1 Tax=Deinococcus sp. TaxID=47478 RepID=UPI003CC516B8